MLLALWLPQMLNSLRGYVEGGAATGVGSTLYTLYVLSARGGRAMILILLMVLSGRRLAEFGLTRLTGKAFGVGLVASIFMVVTALGYASITRELHWDHHLVGRGWSYGYGFVGLLMMAVGVTYEELIYRSFLQTRLKDIPWRTGTIIVFTSALFAVTHIYQGAVALPLVFLHGLLLGFLFDRFRSIWPGLVAHFLYDPYAIDGQVLLRFLLGHR